MAAFQPFEPRGFVWESFSLLRAGQEKSAADINQALFYRGYSAEAYQRGLDTLLERGWVEKSSAGFRQSAAGRAVQAEVERRTDQYFFGPWSMVSAEETAELTAGMNDLEGRLKQYAAEQ